MSIYSLRLRLLIGAGAWLFVALLLAGAAIVFIFAASVERDRYEDLTSAVDRVLIGISADGALSGLAPPLSDPRYATPASGRYWQVLDLGTGETVRSRSLWDVDLVVPAPSGPGAPSRARVAGPSRQRLDAVTQDVVLPGSGGDRQLRVSVAEDVAIRGRNVQSFAGDIAWAFIALAVALLVAGWLTVHLGLKPLARVRQELEAVAAGRLPKLAGRYPQELVPLVDTVNALLATHERSIALARTRADDLAHGLNTPLAVLSATAARLRSSGDVESAEVLEMLGAEMKLRVDYQLRLAQLRLRSDDRALSAALDEMVLRSVAVLRKTGRGEELFWKVDTDRVTVDMDPHDLMELVGVLLENAAKWARTEVRVACRAQGTMAEFELHDDGPGLTDAQIAMLGERGKRLDEARSGTGFGLAIAREVLQLNRGTLHLSRSDAGGLRVLVRIPLAGGSGRRDPA